MIFLGRRMDSGNITSVALCFLGIAFFYRCSCTVFAVAVTVGAVVLFQQGAFLIGGEKTSILSTLEPITSVLIGVAVYQEQLSFYVIIGSVLVIAASALIALLDVQKRKG